MNTEKTEKSNVRGWIMAGLLGVFLLTADFIFADGGLILCHKVYNGCVSNVGYLEAAPGGYDGTVALIRNMTR